MSQFKQLVFKRGLGDAISIGILFVTLGLSQPIVCPLMFSGCVSDVGTGRCIATLVSFCSFWAVTTKINRMHEKGPH